MMGPNHPGNGIGVTPVQQHSTNNASVSDDLLARKKRALDAPLTGLPQQLRQRLTAAQASRSIVQNGGIGGGGSANNTMVRLLARILLLRHLDPCHDYCTMHAFMVSALHACVPKSMSLMTHVWGVVDRLKETLYLMETIVVCHVFCNNYRALRQTNNHRSVHRITSTSY